MLSPVPRWDLAAVFSPCGARAGHGGAEGAEQPRRARCPMLLCQEGWRDGCEAADLGWPSRKLPLGRQPGRAAGTRR